MVQPRTLVTVFLLLFAAGLVQMAAFYPRMPASMASHFGAGGQADKWTTKHSFFTGMAALEVGAAVLLLGIAVAMRYIPMRFMNIPHTEYWADPEREDETRERLYCDMLWFGCATLILLNAVVYLTFRANLRPDRSMGHWPWVVMAAYLAWTVGWAVRMIWRFYRIPREDADEDGPSGAG